MAPTDSSSPLAFGVATLYLIIWAWQDIAFVGSGERLLRLGLMIGFAFAGSPGRLDSLPPHGFDQPIMNGRDITALGYKARSSGWR
ncbi:MAG TPA: hypothetical protein VGR35_14755 [Tepidisphaeraceae bacterium]|nr:hypothetical protein [Tepidisphaeraceae bacterium]